MDFAVGSASGPATIRINFPPSDLLQFPPDDLPPILPASQLARPTWDQPFNIPDALYAQLLDVRVPVTIASVYAVSVVLLNRVNKRRGYKPWGFSQTRAFKAFVIVHNVLLAIYSGWTFAAMFKAFRNSWPDRNDPNGLVGLTDALCKINGPRGYGNAALYNTTLKQWTLPNSQFSLVQGGVPDPLDAGRLWNQGLAFLGWIFYLSKFYEVFDTAIILAKGKRSSTLQTYHHTGAMMCMWAGIRYMAAPIWIFTLVNSFIHAMMYTYYTVTAVHIRVPGIVKRTLTSMQITQFLFGTTMASAYLFVSYSIPSETGAGAGAGATAAATSWLKKLTAAAATTANAAETASNPQGRMVHCLHSSGQGFAVWLNVSYLLPLTVLFLRFFVRSYLSRKDTQAGGRGGVGGPVAQPTHIHAAERAGMDALRDVSREIHESVAVHGETSEATEATEDEFVKAASGGKAKVAGLTKAKPDANGTGTGKANGTGKVNGTGAGTGPGTAAGDSPIRTRSTARRTKTPEPSAGAGAGAGAGAANPPETSNPYDVLRS